MRHVVVISDVHLCEIERGEGPWMRYRQRAFCPDDELAKTIAEVRRATTGDALTLVLNGDVFDLDAPRVVDGETVFHDLPRTAEHAIPALAAILDDHPRVERAIVDAIASGAKLVVISGNHDPHLTLPEVRAFLRERWMKPGAKGELVFRSWFHLEDGMLIEHGHQYDANCAFRTPSLPFDDDREIHPTMGSIATRNLVARLGFFNPHDDASFMLSAKGYVAHWLRHYLFSRRSFFLTWAVGTLRSAAALFHVRSREDRRRRREAMRRAAEETGASLKSIAKHARLFAEPVDRRFVRALRELHVDRLALVVVALAMAALSFVFFRSALRFSGLAIGALTIAAYERAFPRKPLNANWIRIGSVAEHLAKVHRARAVVLGHTHSPEGRWKNGVFLGNSGSWTPIFATSESTAATFARTFIWLSSDRGALGGGLYAFDDGRIVPRAAIDRPAKRPPARSIARTPAPLETQLDH